MIWLVNAFLMVVVYLLLAERLIKMLDGLQISFQFAVREEPQARVRAFGVQFKRAYAVGK